MSLLSCRVWKRRIYAVFLCGKSISQAHSWPCTGQQTLVVSWTAFLHLCSHSSVLFFVCLFVLFCFVFFYQPQASECGSQGIPKLFSQLFTDHEGNISLFVIQFQKKRLGCQLEAAFVVLKFTLGECGQIPLHTSFPFTQGKD